MTTPAYEGNGQPMSREAFYTVACDPQRSVVIEACAGAGKTWMLVSRILRALLEGARPEEILAITFTRKAAGEMRERLSEWLSQFAASTMNDAQRAQELVFRGISPARAQELVPALASLHERVLLAGRPVEISTFHAWFSQLLRAAPLELLTQLGLQPGMQLVEQLADHQGEIFRRFHAKLLHDDNLRAQYMGLIAKRGRLPTQQWLQASLEKRVELELADAAGTLEASVPAAQALWTAFAELKHPTERIFSAEVKPLLMRVASDLGSQGKIPSAQGSLLEQAMALSDSRHALAGARAALFTKDGSVRKKLAAKELNDAVAVLDEIEQACQQQAAHEEHMCLVHLSRLLLAEYAAYKRSEGLADMADLESCALALLRDGSLACWVEERLDAQIQHVLIDEFQDTSPLQWHALHGWLSTRTAAGGPVESKRPLSVFIVGDPKQSIYRFRRAEPLVFMAARHFVVNDLHGAWLACDHTRRNAPEVLTALNDVFLQAERLGDYSGFRPHTTEVKALPGAGLRALPAVMRPPKVKNGEPAPMSWRDSLTTPRHEPDAVLREQEARAVAMAIQEMVLAGQARPGEIFVLSRKRASLRLVAQALRSLHVPFSAAEEFALMEAPEARDLVATLDAIVSPTHHASLAQALKCPLFSATDQDLIALASLAGLQNDWWLALTGNPHDGRAVLQRASRLLLRWQALADELSPHALLDLIVWEGQYHERVAATVPPEQRLAALDAIDAVLAQALTLDGACYATPYNFVRALKRRTIAVTAPVQPDAVQLLTIHGAKGLEARVVFIMDTQPEAPTTDTATLLVEWPVEAFHPQRCAFIYSESQCPPSLQTLFTHEIAARQREELNGLYVAMTRAREQLVLSRTEPFRAAPGLSWWQRMEALSTPWTPIDKPPPIASTPSAMIVLKSLPTWTRAAPTFVAAKSQTSVGEANTETELTRLGKAVHRVLEWATASWRPQENSIDTLVDAAALEFAAPPGEVMRVAACILRSSACQHFFRGSAIQWAGNEVAVADAAELLRIDRLVALVESGQRVWWVLDYKLALQPQAKIDNRSQLLRYRAVVQKLQPNESVRCALISGAGELIEVT